MYQKITILGNVGTIREKKHSSGGLEFINFSLAVNKKVKGQEKVTWFKVVTFGKTVDVVCNYMNKGDKVLVEGEISTSSYQNKEGQTVDDWNVIANRLVLLSPKGASQDNANPKVQGNYKAPAPKGSFADEDIPF